MDINWYPGHMARAKRLLADQLRRVDVVLELCDARLPDSSRNPDLERMIAGKSRVLLMNKSDLADPNVTAAWLRYYKLRGVTAAPYCATAGKAKEALALIDRAAREAVEKAAAKGMRKTVRAMVIGVPNVGKSTFINKLHGSGIARTGDKPGVTRGRQWISIDAGLDLLDTPGILWPKFDSQEVGEMLAITNAIKADVLDKETLGANFMLRLSRLYPDALRERYKIEPDPALNGYELLEAAAKKRGFLLSKGEYDIERMANTLLKEYHEGKLGRLSLETPDDGPLDAGE